MQTITIEVISTWNFDAKKIQKDQMEKSMKRWKPSQIENRMGQDWSIYSSRFNCCFFMPEPPAAAVTAQAGTGETVCRGKSPGFRSLWMSWHRSLWVSWHRPTKRDLRTICLSGELLGSWGRSWPNFLTTTKKFRWTLQRMVEKVNPSKRWWPELRAAAFYSIIRTVFPAVPFALFNPPTVRSSLQFSPYPESPNDIPSNLHTTRPLFSRLWIQK